VRLTAASEGHTHVSSHWQTHIYLPEKQHAFTYFGFYEHVLQMKEETLRIAKKKIILLNDVVESVLDIYHV
jgi:3-phenylpropionate/cinnamic acid dioxygenase small subunit